MKWIVREGKVRGEGRYYEIGGKFSSLREDAWYFPSREGADGIVDQFGGRVVRLLTHEESKRKAAAEALRAFVDRQIEKDPLRVACEQEVELIQGFVTMVKRNEAEFLTKGETPADRREAASQAAYEEWSAKPVSPFGRPHTREELRELRISFLSLVMRGDRAQVESAGRLFATIDALENKLNQIHDLSERLP